MKELVSHFFKSFLISPSFFPFLFLIFLTFSFIFLNLILILFCILSNVPTVLLDIFVSDCKSECSMQIAFLTTFQYHFPLFAFPFFFFYLLLSLPLIFSRVSFFFSLFYLSFTIFLFSFFFFSLPSCMYVQSMPSGKPTVSNQGPESKKSESNNPDSSNGNLGIMKSLNTMGGK